MEKTKAILRDIEQRRITQICRNILGEEVETEEKSLIKLMDLTGNAAWELNTIGTYNYETILEIAALTVKILEQIEEE